MSSNLTEEASFLERPGGQAVSQTLIHARSIWKKQQKIYMNGQKRNRLVQKQTMEGQGNSAARLTAGRDHIDVGNASSPHPRCPP
ncbi:Hypp855 [Branchiostoma lanceolatum]|uniref:Hypp855 protein n=1 Tax=Branchiostoma lanceolatum TaxID=7740 RepID=A0A8J9VWM8_BRALA|nr:Hypp855 [Branchiostoma lanceolatum]